MVGSLVVIVKVTPAQPVPDLPCPTAESWKAPGSAPATGQSLFGVNVPQDGTSVMSESVTLPVASAPFERLLMVTLAARPAWPTVTGEGKVGTTQRPTPAKASGMATRKGTTATIIAVSTVAARAARLLDARGDVFPNPDPTPCMCVCSPRGSFEGKYHRSG